MVTCFLHPWCSTCNYTRDFLLECSVTILLLVVLGIFPKSGVFEFSFCIYSAIQENPADKKPGVGKPEEKKTAEYDRYKQEKKDEG